MYEKILIPLDGSPSAEASLPCAEELAGRLESEVTLVHVSEEPEESTQPERRLYLEKMVETLKQSSGVKSAFLTGNPAEKIVEYADEEDIGLIVMTTRGKSGARSRGLGGVADKVVRLAGCPVLLIRADGARPDAGVLGKVLVPLDGSEHDEAAVRQAGEFVSKLEAEVVLFQVLTPECYVPAG